MSSTDLADLEQQVFEVISAVEVLEHIPDDEIDGFEEPERHATPGVVMISVPSPPFLHPKHYRHYDESCRRRCGRVPRAAAGPLRPSTDGACSSTPRSTRIASSSWISRRFAGCWPISSAAPGAGVWDAADICSVSSGSLSLERELHGFPTGRRPGRGLLIMPHRRVDAEGHAPAEVRGGPATYAAALVRLGQPAALLTKVGADSFSDFLLDALRDEGVDTSHIGRESDRQIGLCYHECIDGRTSLHFYRHDSAATCLAPDDVDGALISWRRGCTSPARPFRSARRPGMR